MNKTENTSVNFDNASGVYDKTRHIPEAILNNAISLLESNNHITKGSDLLDLGCGTGQLTEAFAQNGYKCTGVDISEEMLEAAEKKKSENIRYLIGDATNLEFSNERFETGIASKLFLHIRKWRKAIDEILRVLKKGGCFVYINEIGFFSNEVRKHFRRLADERKYTNRFLGSFDLDEIRDCFTARGCSHVRYRDKTLQWKKKISYRTAFDEIKNKSFAEFWTIDDSIYAEMLEKTKEWIELKDNSWEIVQEMKPELYIDVYGKDKE